MEIRYFGGFIRHAKRAHIGIVDRIFSHGSTAVTAIHLITYKVHDDANLLSISIACLGLITGSLLYHATKNPRNL